MEIQKRQRIERLEHLNARASSLVVIIDKISRRVSNRLCEMRRITAEPVAWRLKRKASKQMRAITLSFTNQVQCNMRALDELRSCRQEIDELRLAIASSA